MGRRTLAAQVTVASRGALASMEVELAGPLAQSRTLPVPPCLEALFPEEGLRRGSTLAVVPGPVPGSTYLALSLLAAPTRAGSWCAVVGSAGLGLVAAAQMGTDLEHVALVPVPGRQWPTVTASFLEGFDLVLLRPPASVTHSDARKLEARARERGSVLVVMSAQWPVAADISISVTAASWHGLGQGHGHLQGADVEVVTRGRGAAARPRRVRLWLGGQRAWRGQSAVKLVPVLAS